MSLMAKEKKCTVASLVSRQGDYHHEIQSIKYFGDRHLLFSIITPRNCQKTLFQEGGVIEMAGKTMTKSSLLIGFLFLFMITFTSAWPYQLNLSNGILYDSNISNNATSNFTIYVVMLNQTYLNLTNYTYLNITINQTNFTCYNCTNINYTNYTYTYVYSINGSSNSSFYNSSDVNAKFLSIIDFNAYKSSLLYINQAEFQALLLQVNSLMNRTEIIEDNNSHGSLWGGIIIVAVISLIGIYLVYKGSSDAI